MSEIAHASTAGERNGLAALLLGAVAAPIVWLGQLMLSYGVSAFVCYPADHPVGIASGTVLRAVLIGFDIAAVVVALAGGLNALWCLRQADRAKESGSQHVLRIGEGRARFLALWGVFSSLCFLVAILFGIIASVTVPLCTA